MDAQFSGANTYFFNAWVEVKIAVFNLELYITFLRTGFRAKEISVINWSESFFNYLLDVQQIFYSDENFKIGFPKDQFFYRFFFSVFSYT